MENSIGFEDYDYIDDDFDEDDFDEEVARVINSISKSDLKKISKEIDDELYQEEEETDYLED